MRSVNEPCLVLEPSIANSHHLDKTTRCPIRSNGSEVFSGVSCALSTPTTPVTIIWLINSYTKIHFDFEVQLELQEPERKKVLSLEPLQSHEGFSRTTSVTFAKASQVFSTASDSLGYYAQIVDLPSALNVLAKILPPGIVADMTGVDRNWTLPPLDLALSFAILACLLVSTRDTSESSYYFELSIYWINEHAGGQTIDLVVIHLFHHLYALRTGSSNRSRATVDQAIQVAHDLSLHQKTSDVHASYVYLILCFTDQYCAMSHACMTRIKASNLELENFHPLLEEHPELRPVVNMVQLNGKIIERLYDGESTGMEEVVDIEQDIVQARSERSSKVRSSDDTPEAQFESLVSINMYWLRVLLRIPLLASSRGWLSSISVGVRGAQMILLEYYEIVSKRQTVTANNASSCSYKSNSTGRHILPSTWRQVCRIMTSCLILFYAFWHMELSHAELSQFVAKTLVLLHGHSLRWGESLDNMKTTLRELSALCNIDIQGSLEELLPNHDSELEAGVLSQRTQPTDSQESFFFGSDATVRQSTIISTNPVPEVFSSIDTAWASGYGCFDPYALTDGFDTDLDFSFLHALGGVHFPTVHPST
ncbi:hypothetical protein D6D29_07568 [Aureobasidium pullulans]|nr:hypothetical protein D6D29_07568 [Aureobasidium pullulans]